MKKVFFLMAFLFAVVCYATPPPDVPISFLTEDVGFIRSQVDFSYSAIKMQETTFVNFNCNRNSKPGYISKLNGWKPNKQNTNFGYPFGANY